MIAVTQLALHWERLDGYGVLEGEYAFEAHNPRDPNPDRYYYVVVTEGSVRLPEAQHRFAVAWIDDGVLWTDIEFGEDFPLARAIGIAERHARSHFDPVVN
jgi:hypothetical protein